MSTLPLFDDDRGGTPKRGSGGRGGRGGGSGGSGGGGNDDAERTYRVGQLNRAARRLLEDRFGNLWVEGELSDVTRAASGHVYFTLNDEQEAAQVRGVMFRSDAQRAKARLENGARVRLRGTISIFEPRGSYQLQARIALPAGLGELHAQFEAVRKRLEADGLLDPARKRPLPLLPRVVGVVTSAEGAAVHDILRVAHGRCPVRIVISPCLVQGPQAPRAIAEALARVERVPGLDVVIIGRGGGSAEDLIAFNDEQLARRIARCPVPVVSAVGHEVDVSISDLVADVRAATPSNAAELVVPDRDALVHRLQSHRRMLERAMESRLARGRLRLQHAERQLRDPRTALSGMRQRLQALTHALQRRGRGTTQAQRRALAALVERLSRRDPRLLVAQRRARLSQLDAQLRAAGKQITRDGRRQLGTLGGQLSALSPLQVLARGYAIALHAETGKAILRASDVKPGDAIELRLHDGQLRTRVES